VELRFTLPNLRALDKLGTEILVANTTVDERPAQGVAGLVDWRLAGRLSRLMQRRFLTGELGEVVLVPAKPKLPFDKVLLFGLGRRQDFDLSVYHAVLERILRTLEGLRARTAVVELPGRHFDAITAEHAADLLLSSVGGSREHDVWTLVESADPQRAVTHHMIQERRRVRRT
jgi:hypothetical protein